MVSLKKVRAWRVSSSLKYSIQMAAIALFVGFIMYTAVSRILILNVERSLVSFADQGAKTVDAFLDGHISELKSISANSIVSNSGLPVNQRLNELKKQLKKDNFLRLSLADMQGNSITTEGIRVNISDREYFQRAALGTPNISEPLVSRVDGTLVIVFAVPVIENDRITGVLYATYNADILSQMTDEIKLNDKGSSFILDRNGYTIAHDDRSLVYRRDNNFINIRNQPELTRLVELEKKMIAGRSGSGVYVYNGITKYMGFCPIGDIGWSIAVTSPKNEVLGLLNIVFLILLVSTVIVTMLVAILLTRSRKLMIDLSKQQVSSTRAADVTNLIMLSINHDGGIMKKNKYADKLLNYFSQGSSGQITNIFELLTPSEGEKFKDILVNSLLQNSSASFELALKYRGLDALFLYCSMAVDRETGEAFEILGLDITERVESQNRLQDSFDELNAVYEELAVTEEGLRNNYNELKRVQDKLRLSENRYQLVIEGSNDAIWDWDAVNDELFYSDKFNEMTGYRRHEIERKWNGIRAIIHPEDIKLLEKAYIDYISGIKPILRCEIKMRLNSGDYRWFVVKGRAVFNDDGKVIRAAGSLIDINERKMNEQMIRQLAFMDPLTGLPNRLAFYNEINDEFVRFGETCKFALIYLNIDNFKFVNDFFSHHVGDMVLVEVGKRLMGIVRRDEFIARLEGDTFVIFIKKFGTTGELDTKIQAVINTFDEPYIVSGNCFHITASCGISVYPEHGNTTEEIIKSADMAMHHSKKEGKRKHNIFKKSMQDEFVQRATMENGLSGAIDNNEFILHYQPQYDLTTGRITGLEALIRWIRPGHGLVPPLKFISVAEETGQIVPIGRWALFTACSFIKRLNGTAGRDLEIAVNVSVTQLLQADFVQMIRDILNETGLEPRLLELELTESRIIEEIDLNLQKLTELRELGVRISIDDFGKGFSSLSYLKQLPINSLKIDKSFVDDIQSDAKCMVESIIHIGHQRGLVVIAEGVEKMEQTEYLTRYHCDKAQGYLYSRPVPENDVIGLLQ